MIKAGIKGGIGALQKKLGRAAEVLEQGRNRAVQEATLRIHAEAVKLIQSNADGRTDIRYKPKRVVNVSKPGSPPNTDTGRLVQSIKFEFADDLSSGFVGSNLKYAAWLEFGTENMSARPWLSTAVEITAKDVAKIFEKNFEKALKKAVS